MKRTISRAGRLLLLYRLREAGVLDGQTLQAIGDALGVDRSTILRDCRELDHVEEEYQRLIAEQPWVKSELTVTEFADEIGASPETVRAMIRDGLVKAHKRPGKGHGGRWYVPVEEADRFRRSEWAG